MQNIYWEIEGIKGESTSAQGKDMIEVLSYNHGVSMPLTSGPSNTSRASQCSTGNCVDGFCCDTACNGACLACSGVLIGNGINGTCKNISAGNQAPPTCTTPKACSLSGACLLMPGEICTMNSECVSGSCNMSRNKCL